MIIKHKSTAHNRRRQQKTGREEKDLTAARTLLFGALAGATAESILYPLEVLRRRYAYPTMLTDLTVEKMYDIHQATSFPWWRAKLDRT